ncbi:translocation/assembly module TamB domain-containing protein [Suttonella sp. R2A3]|uniref:translocation/assembly module TamB domain-containing protein n=1 Tax=Suttonella sp. R2A3 TaxID=2908648 RepID=UPI001F45CA1C|nr:translocation/assembly module TamB domain-containing protein [Suttonella sp. R2A3]UJF24515.1 translocation/assembly module TamB domain-containing protein [Suttonella sp. R2A3]
MRGLWRGLWRITKWLLITILCLLIVLFAAVFYLTGTEHGYRQIPKLVNTFTSYRIDYESLSGTFWSEQSWRKLKVSGPALDLQAEELSLDNATALFAKKVGIASATFRDATINLHPQEKPQEEQKEGGIPESLPDLRLPVDIVFHNIGLARVSITQDDVPMLEIHEANVDGAWLDGQLELTGDVDTDRAVGDLSVAIQTYADYPLDINLDAGLVNDEGAQYQNVVLRGEGSALKPNLTIKASGDASLDASLTGVIDLAARQLDARLDWQEFSAAEGAVASPSGVLTLGGAFDDLAIVLDSELSGAGVPTTQLRAQANLGADKLHNIDVLAKLLDGEVRLQGEAGFAEQPNWQGELAISGINASKYDEALDGTINGRLTTQGEMTSDGLHADVLVESLDGQWQGQPVSGQGLLAWRGERLNAEDFQLIFAGNSLRANGGLGGSDDTLNLDIEAKHLDAVVAELSGDVSGDIALSGALDNPQVKGAIDWRDIAYQGAYQSEQGKLTLDGVLNALNIQAALVASGKDLPRSDINASVLYTPEQVRDVDVTLKAGDGSAHISGAVDLTPQIAWDAEITTDHFDPGLFLEGYSGKVDAKIVSKGNVSALGGVNAIAEIKSLDGQWFGEALSGGGTVTIEDNNLRLDGLALGIGNNKLSLGGAFDGEKLDFDVDVDGQNLATLYAPLAGTFSAKGHIGGTKSQPQAKLDVSAKNIAYQDYRVRALEGTVDTSLERDGAFDNVIKIDGLDLVGQRWETVRLTTQGIYQDHALKFSTSGGEVNVDMNAEGGLKGLDAWAGKLNALTIKGEGLDWKLTKPADVTLSPKAVALNPFCLSDPHSNLCLDIAYAEQATINYDIAKLSPKSFAYWLPDMISLGTEASGKGTINIDQAGAINGTANIALSPGQIRISPQDGAPITLHLQEAQAKAVFSGSEANVGMALSFRDAGEFILDGKVNNFSDPSIAGRLQMDVPDVGKFKYLVPQVSELQGRVQGDLRFSGKASDPAIGGQIILDDGRVVIPEYSTELNDIRLELSARQSGQIDILGNVGTPEGALDINGALNLSPLTLNMNLSGDRLLLADAETMRVVASPKFDVVIDPDTGITLNGDVLIPEAKISIPDTSSGRSLSEDVVIVGEDKQNAQEKLEETQTPFNAKIGLQLGDNVYFKNKDVDIRLLGGINITMLPSQPITARGTISIASGEYKLYGQELNIERGDVVFSGGNIANPYINFLALREVEDVNVGAEVKGSVDTLQLTLTSTPIMPDSAILSYLLFGRSPDSGTDANALLQAAGNYAVGGLVSDEITESTGLDVFDLGISGLEAGKYLGEDIYVGMQSDFFNAVTEFIARYQFTDRLKAEASTSGDVQAIDFIYEFETD